MFTEAQQHNLALSPAKAQPSSIDADFLVRAVASAGVSPNPDKIVDLHQHAHA